MCICPQAISLIISDISNSNNTLLLSYLLSFIIDSNRLRSLLKQSFFFIILKFAGLHGVHECMNLCFLLNFYIL